MTAFTVSLWFNCACSDCSTFSDVIKVLGKKALLMRYSKVHQAHYDLELSDFIFLLVCLIENSEWKNTKNPWVPINYVTNLESVPLLDAIIHSKEKLFS